MPTTRHWQSGPGGGCGSCGSGEPWPCTAMRLAVTRLALHKVYQETLKYGELNLGRAIRAIIDESRKEPEPGECESCGIMVDPGRTLCSGCGRGEFEG